MKIMSMNNKQQNFGKLQIQLDWDSTLPQVKRLLTDVLPEKQIPLGVVDRNKGIYTAKSTPANEALLIKGLKQLGVIVDNVDPITLRSVESSSYKLPRGVVESLEKYPISTMEAHFNKLA